MWVSYQQLVLATFSSRQFLSTWNQSWKRLPDVDKQHFFNTHCLDLTLINISSRYKWWDDFEKRDVKPVKERKNWKTGGEDMDRQSLRDDCVKPFLGFQTFIFKFLKSTKRTLTLKDGIQRSTNQRHWCPRTSLRSAKNIWWQLSKTYGSSPLLCAIWEIWAGFLSFFGILIKPVLENPFPFLSCTQKLERWVSKFLHTVQWSALIFSALSAETTCWHHFYG